jgi:3-oxoacyl-[acyl-carrier protein] reductase
MTITATHALITGGSRGIGPSIALKLAEHGVHVAINYLRDEASPVRRWPPTVARR